MASSADSNDHESETDEDDVSRFVVTPEQLREGDFKTLDGAREAIGESTE